MSAQDLLNESLCNLLTLQESSHNLTFDQAMDLSGAINRLNDILSDLESEEKDWDAEGFSEFLKTKDQRINNVISKADEIISGCEQLQ